MKFIFLLEDWDTIEAGTLEAGTLEAYN